MPLSASASMSQAQTEVPAPTSASRINRSCCSSVAIAVPSASGGAQAVDERGLDPLRTDARQAAGVAETADAVETGRAIELQFFLQPDHLRARVQRWCVLRAGRAEHGDLRDAERRRDVHQA